jgi:hypothetical protein
VKYMFLFCSKRVKARVRGFSCDCKRRSLTVLTLSAKRSQGPASGTPKGGRELKQNPMLDAYSRRRGRMGLSVSKRPVVLIVEDEFLLRMDAADMISGAGFEVIEAGNAD